MRRGDTASLKIHSDTLQPKLAKMFALDKAAACAAAEAAAAAASCCADSGFGMCMLLLCLCHVSPHHTHTVACKAATLFRR